MFTLEGGNGNGNGKKHPKYIYVIDFAVAVAIATPSSVNTFNDAVAVAVTQCERTFIRALFPQIFVSFFKNSAATSLVY